MMEDLYARMGSPPRKNALAKIRVKAMRRGVWFRVLTRAERAQVELTLRIVKNIRSLFLAKVVTSIVKKLLDAMESRVSRFIRKVGQPLARKLSEIAQEWGNKSVNSWSQDSGFVQYLTIMHLNKPRSRSLNE